jgi:hypothetical protein
VVPSFGLVVELYDEHGQLAEKTNPTIPPADIVIGSSLDGRRVGLRVPETILESPTTVQIHLDGTLSKRDLIDQADAESRAMGIIPIPGVEAVEFTTDGDLGTSVTITLSYPSSLEGAIVNNLAAFTFEEADQRWNRLQASQIDPAKHCISFEVDHFSVYKIMAQAADDLDDVIVYPNPFIASEAYGGCLKFINLTPVATIRIYSILGELVWTEEILGGDGAAQWYGENDGGESVASGIYVYVITNSSGHEVTGKISVMK